VESIRLYQSSIGAEFNLSGPLLLFGGAITSGQFSIAFTDARGSVVLTREYFRSRTGSLVGQVILFCQMITLGLDTAKQAGNVLIWLSESQPKPGYRHWTGNDDKSRKTHDGIVDLQESPLHISGCGPSEIRSR
jgi:hypothetical protein